MTPRERVKDIIDRLLADVEEYKGGAGTDLRRLWRTYLRPERLRFFVALAMALLWSAAPLGFPLTARYLTDEVLCVGRSLPPEAFDRHLGLLWIVIGLNSGIWAIMLVSSWLRSVFIVRAGQQLVFRLRRDLHEKLQALHIGFYEQTPSGRIMSRVLDDVGVIHKWCTTQLINLVNSVAKIGLGAALLFYLNWKLALVVMVCLPLYAWAFVVLRPLIRRANIALRRLNSAMYALAAERVHGVQVVKAFARERGELRRFGRMVMERIRVALTLVRYNLLLSLLAATVTGLASGAVIYAALLEVRDGVLSIGDVVAFIVTVTHLFEPVNVLTTLLTSVQAVLVVLRRVFALLDEDVELTPGRIHLSGMEGKVTFDAVSFTYPGHSRPALDRVSFRIHPGQKVAIMGPSGSGKSTIFQLLLRFYEPQSGQVRVGGVNVQDADPGSLRRHVVMVQQEPVIFSGTVADNIIYGRLDATPSQVMQAATQAELHGFIMSLPVKYETEVGEDGVTLSGGQRQRLALATALLTDPEILLLDDTTSALDAGTEARIRDTLNRVLEGRTSLIITQRIATALDCDQILVLEHGRVTQRGTHAELSTQEGFYRMVYEQQGAL